MSSLIEFEYLCNVQAAVALAVWFVHLPCWVTTCYAFSKVSHLLLLLISVSPAMVF